MFKKSFAYVQNIGIPSQKAHSVYVVKTCEAASKLNYKTNLVISKRKNYTNKNIWSYYQVDKKDFLVKKIKKARNIYIASVRTNSDIFIRPIKFNKKKNYLITVARLEKEKNIDLIIKAFKEISFQFPKWKLVIIGSGSQEKSLKTLVKKLNLSHKVIFTGQLTVKKVQQQFKQAKIFVLPSQYEGWGLATIEAMAAGLAIIISHTGIALEIIKPGYNGLIVQKNVDSIQQAIKQLIINPQLCRKISRQAQETIKQWLTNQLNFADISRLLIKHTL